MNFKCRNLKDLPDSQVDEDRLKEVFTTLGFTVMPHQDLNAMQMMDELEGYAKKMEDYKGKALIVIILSHECKGDVKGDVVYGTDGGQVNLHEMQEVFFGTNCPFLKRAPKVFLIDACRGKNSKRVCDNDNQRQGSTSQACGVITDSLNFATVFASTRGNAAFVYKESDEKRGSYFTQTLVEVIKEADENKEFNEIITEVRLRILKEAAKAAEEIKSEKEKKPKEDVKVPAQNLQQQVMALQAEKIVETQTVQYNSTLERLYYIKRKKGL